MDFFIREKFFFLYRKAEDKHFLISDRSIEDLIAIANRQLIKAPWVIKNQAGEILYTYRSSQ